MKKLIIFSALALLIIYSCNKDQQVVKQLEGTWEVSEMTVDGQPENDSTYEGTTYTFEKCKLKKEEYCPGEISYYDDMKGMSVSMPFEYAISEKGEKFTLVLDFSAYGLGKDESVGDIVQHTKDKFVFSTTDTSGTVVTTLIPSE